MLACWPPPQIAIFPFKLPSLLSFNPLITLQPRDLAPSHPLIDAPIAQELKITLFQHLPNKRKLLAESITSKSKNLSQTSAPTPRQITISPFSLSQDCNLTDQIANRPLSDSNPIPISAHLKNTLELNFLPHSPPSQPSLYVFVSI